jgi:DNA-binding MarR family transcriptional regulator
MTQILNYPSMLPEARRDELSALIIAGTEEQGRVAAHALESVGVRECARVDFAEAGTKLCDHSSLDLIVIEAAAAPEALLDTVLARADTLARERPLNVVATLVIEQVDTAVAHLLGPRAQLLCNPSDGERAAALAIACARVGFIKPVEERVAGDARRESESARLARLNEEVARIADTLVRLTRDDEGPAFNSVRDPGTGYRGPELADLPGASAQEIRAVIRARRLRAQFFGQDMFADPAWDMLLDLYAASLEQRRVSVSSLCIAAAVPPTTALRWIGTLHDEGLFERQADPTDRRRAYIALSEKGVDGMCNYIAAVKRQGLNLV